jgi:hypothetical protein
MADPQPPANPPPIPRTYAPVPALLSYLVPGLGQVVQGRIAKGLLFFVCLYGLFFYGMSLGHWQNVYVPESQPTRTGIWRLIDAVTDRARFLGQAGIGMVAWPAVAQYVAGTPYIQLPDGGRGKIVVRKETTSSDPVFEVRAPGEQRGYKYKGRTGDTVEVEVTKPGKGGGEDIKETLRLPVRGLPVLGTFMGEPDEELMNQLLRDSDKKIELGWMYTVIAGVLNILVIYDAFAGPAFFGAAKGPAAPKPEEKKEEAAAA